VSADGKEDKQTNRHQFDNVGTPDTQANMLVDINNVKIMADSVVISTLFCWPTINSVGLCVTDVYMQPTLLAVFLTIFVRQ